MFEARTRAAETERNRALWLAREQAILNAYAYHKPGKLPTLAKLLGIKPKPGEIGASRRASMRALVEQSGGKVTKRGRP